MRAFVAVLACLAACSPDAGPPQPPPAEAPPPVPEGPPPVALIDFQAPATWKKQVPANRLRNAQYAVPDRDGKSADAELTLSHFRVRSDPQDNINRWSGQMGDSNPKVEILEGKCKVTFAEFKGSYLPDSQTEPIADARMLAAIVDASDGPWYFKLVGPADTVGDWRAEFVDMVKGAHK
jgi:hypothetical protein